MIGNGYKTYSDKTLMNCKKAELIEFIRALEHNLRVANEMEKRQAKIIQELINIGKSFSEEEASQYEDAINSLLTKTGDIFDS